MKLTCSQMDVLISFYIEGELSHALKQQVEEHIKACSTCRAKYDIIKSMLTELKNNLDLDKEHCKKEVAQTREASTISEQYRLFKNNLSAYIDNELPDEENIKIKKFAINNTKARQELEDSYNIRRLMNESFRKTKAESRHDFSKNVIKQLELEGEAVSGIHPVIKLLIVFVLVTLIITSFVLSTLSV